LPLPGANPKPPALRVDSLLDFERLRQRAIELGVDESRLRASSEFNRDLRTIEKSSSAFVQWRNTWDFSIPLHFSGGLRYEKTRVRSPSTILLPASHVIWPTNLPEFFFAIGTDPILGEERGEYDYWLPSLDIRAELSDNLVARASYGKSIGRASWSNLQGETVLNNALRAQEGEGFLGNPGLLPLESKNFDLSLEWYYAQGSYVSLGYFRKNIRNAISNSIVRASPYDVSTPVGGRYWDDAINRSMGGCLDADFACIREDIFTRHRGEDGVIYMGDDEAGRPTGIIMGIATDPLAEFNLTAPVNQRSDKLDGWELNVQHMLGNSGFALNYTKVDSGLKFENTLLGDQYPMVGLSDTANLVVFYDKHDWQVRVAYNWRDDFLFRASDDTGPHPWYTESHGQLDANITWMINERLSVFVEGINLTDETQRIHSRHRNMLISATQTRPRYMFGLRYKL